MGNGKNTYLKVNEPNIVHETIDGETILLHLGTGNYYSIEWPGTMFWDLLAETGNTEGIKKEFLKTDNENEDKIDEAYSNFIKSLLEEELVVAVENEKVSSLSIDKKTKDEFAKAVSELEKLALNKYSDMKDMLLLDPIHDVDDKGWPEPKKDD